MNLESLPNHSSLYSNPLSCPTFSNPYNDLSKLISETPQYPLNGKITANPSDPTKKDFFDFLGEYRPLVSKDQVKIKALVNNVTNGDYPELMLRQVDLPNVSLAAFEQGLISKWDIAQLLTFHEIKLRNPKPLQIFKIFNEKNELSPELFKCKRYKHIRSNALDFPMSKKVVVKALEAIKILPTSQKIFYITPNDLHITFPLQTEIFFHHEVLGRVMQAIPRLGLFSPIDIIENLFGFKKSTKNEPNFDFQVARKTPPLEKLSSARLVHIPFPGIPSPSVVHGDISVPFQVSMHDRFHYQLGSLLSETLIQAIGELIQVFSKEVGFILSKEIWEVGDLVALELLYHRIAAIKGAIPPFLKNEVNQDVIAMRYYYKEKLTPTEEFELFFRSKTDKGFLLKTLFIDDNHQNLFGWIAFFHMLKNRNEWKNKYGIDFDEINLVLGMKSRYDFAKKYLKKLTLFQKIDCLQKIKPLDLFNEKSTKTKIQKYVMNPPNLLPFKFHSKGPYKNFISLKRTETYEHKKTYPNKDNESERKSNS